MGQDDAANSTPWGEHAAARWPWAQVIALDVRTSPGGARNAGARRAQGEILAFFDADTVPAHDWLDQLERALTIEVDMVGGAILNGRPRSGVAAAAHLLRLLEWTPPRRDALLHAAGGNLLVRRGVFEAAGGFLEDVRCAEDTLLTFLVGRSRRLALAPAAVVHHVQRYDWRAFLQAQYEQGRSYHDLCMRCDFPAGEVTRRGRLGLVLVYRVNGLLRRLLDQRRELGRAIVLAPLILCGLLAWLWGVAEAAGKKFRLPPGLRFL
jgi:glycosyltransferase involved in cell wall biosynthesis